MTGNERELFYIGVISGAAIWFGAIVFIPSCVRSAFRYRMWQVRDDLYDAMLTGSLDAVDDEARALVRRIEESILSIRTFTVFNIAIALAVRRGIGPSEPVVVPISRPAALLNEYEARYAELVIKKAVVGSPSGWLVSIIGGVFLLVASVRRGMLPKTYALAKAAQLGEALVSEQALDKILWKDPDDSAFNGRDRALHASV